MKFIVEIAGREFPFEVKVSPETFVAAYIDLRGLPMDEIAHLAEQADRLTVRTEDGKDSTVIHLIAYKYPAAKLFLAELEELLKPLPQVDVGDIRQMLHETLKEHIYRNIEDWVIPVYAGRVMSEKLGVHTVEEMYRKIAEIVPSAEGALRPDDDPEAMRNRWMTISCYLLMNELKPNTYLKSMLSKMDAFMIALGSLGARSFRHPRLSRMAARDSLRVNWRPVPFVPEAIRCGFHHYVSDQYDGLQVALKFNWVEDEEHDIVYAEIGDFGITSPFIVEYRLYRDGRFTVLLDDGKERELQVEPVSTDIPVPYSTILYVPILDVETLDMMVGLPTTFRQYADYNVFTGVTLPVFARWEKPIEAMFVLDRLATMLTSGMVITDYRKPEVDEDGNVFPFRFVHPHVLKSLLGQVLITQYINPHGARFNLNRVAYAWLWINRHFGDVLKEFPWMRVTVAGYRDEAARMNCEGFGGEYRPVLQRSFPTIERYIIERKALCGASGMPFESDETVLLMR